MTISKEENQRREKVIEEDKDFFKNYFESRGFRVKELDPQDKTKGPKTSKIPDFLVSRDRSRMYCELKSMFDENEFAKETQFEKRLIEKLETFPFCFYFRVGIDIDKIDQLNSKVEKKIMEDLKKQIQDITPNDQLPLRIQDSNKFVEIEITKHDNSEHLKLEPGPDLGFGRGKNGELKTTDRIRNYIKNAQRKFRTLNENASYVLVVFTHTSLLHESQIRGQINLSLQTDKNTTISAIALYKSSYGYFHILHNPFAKCGLDVSIFRGRHNKQVILTKKNNGWNEEIMV